MAGRITIPKMRTKGVNGKILAYFTLSLGALEIEDMKLIDGANGIFVGFPTKKVEKPGEAAKWYDIVRLARDTEGQLTNSAQDFSNEVLKLAVEEFNRRGGKAPLAEASVDAEDSNDLPF